MIVSRFTIFTENFVICCYQVTKISCTRYGSAIASSARGPCNFGPFDRSRNFGLQRNEYRHCAYKKPHFSWMWALKILLKKNWRVTRFSLNSCSHSGISELSGAGLAENNGCLRSVVVSSFFGFRFLFGLRALPGLQQTTGLAVLSSLQHFELDTSTGGESIPL